ncbi:ANTAR domain-containing protein [Streptomyces sp. NPDC090108]|uniref:ANTAR domain-containing protein n=1 Tax=Streptomyces sp. NPDC090108 TaxID=3365947 RepID=UPI0037FF8CCC
MADSEPERITELRTEVDQLKEAVTSHAVVDQAIGMMVALGRISPDQGWEVLKEVSQHTNIKLRTIAELILVWGRRGDIAPEIRAELESALDRHGPVQVPGGEQILPAVTPSSPEATADGAHGAPTGNHP